MQHLPACVDTSITAATFCFHYITANLATKECIRGLTTDHLRHFFRELHPVLLVNDATITDNDDSIEYIQCMQHTLTRTINLVMDNIPTEIIHHFPHGTPASFLSLLNDHQPGSLGHECLKDIASHSFTHLPSNTRCTLDVYATWPLWHHLQRFIPCNYNLSIFKQKQFSTDDKTANNHPTMANLHVMAHHPLLPSNILFWQHNKQHFTK